MKYYTPLRYPGGKAKIANYIKLLLEVNKIRDAVYIEPYAGGAAVALALLQEEYVSEIFINDLSPSIYSFWNAVLYQTDELCALIRETPVTTEEWHIQTEVQLNANKASSLELAYSTFFLNRTSRSGIISKSGIIGGKAQNGKWKIDARYNADELIRRIKLISLYKDRITLSNLDASEFIKTDISSRTNTIFYLDPPYYVAGQELYGNFYTKEQHSQIADAVKLLNRPWIVSYDNHEVIRKLYSQYRRIEYGLNYSAGDKYVGDEIMFFSDDLIVPAVDSPMGLSVEMVNMASEASLFPIKEILK